VHSARPVPERVVEQHVENLTERRVRCVRFEDRLVGTADAELPPGRLEAAVPTLVRRLDDRPQVDRPSFGGAACQQQKIVDRPLEAIGFSEHLVQRGARIGPRVLQLGLDRQPKRRERGA
jgi:hypothetical protein